MLSGANSPALYPMLPDLALDHNLKLDKAFLKMKRKKIINFNVNIAPH